ncbi:glucan 1,4-alpha-glucosidase [Haloarchaeobius amylolyticus]|uniref:glucan 1,4-alpha-glucosidase n=1 Tax=Haloarchaeobius amylolyticus TaxID=1198296 RepID=UPI002270F824|nr:glucan 1,4-alpha-glucosidase [Haloarchaeobius amylolyticus]
MQLRDALNDYKHHRHDATAFPGESRSTTGHFSGRDGRLVHVDPDGSLSDYGYPLTGLNGLERSRFGLRVDDDVVWFDHCQPTAQTYHRHTALVVTDHETHLGSVSQYDLTLGDAHVTYFDCEDLSGEDVEVVAFVGFAPDAQDTRIGQLHHETAIEVFHTDEHDFVASATGFAEIQGQVAAKYGEILSDEPVDLPRPISNGRYEEARLSGNLVAFLPVEDGSATLTTLLTDSSEFPREDALAHLDDLAATYTDAGALEDAATEQVEVPVPDDHDYAEAMAADLRVLSLLSGRTGLRIAGPDFDPFYAYSGGYGYTWFRDDAEISLFLLESAAEYDLALDDWHDQSAAAYADTQREDGSWPHRVWPHDGSLAPGWANGRLESGDDVDYQADQTGSVIAFLGAYADATDDEADRTDVTATLEAALDSLDDTLEDDGRPEVCQNAWEDMTGRFTHTAATFLEAYATLAGTAGVDADLADHAASRARQVYDAMDDLWVPEKGIYALREYTEDEEEGTVLDARCDSATLAVAAAHRTYDQFESVDEARLDRLVSHVETVVQTLWRRPTDEVEGLIRYEGDGWRMREQHDEKIWSVSTAWGAHAAASLAAVLRDHGDDRADEFAALARELLALVLPGGPLCMDTSYLPEQVFDDGTPDSATPLGWPHALRLATVALMDEYDMLAERRAVADQ